jgi:predicted negative regulator of RcsB-dependent stress response
MTAQELRPGRLIDDARRFAEAGDLDRAAAILMRLASDRGGPDQAQAAVGLAVVLGQRGDAEGARAAARAALATGHPEYAAQGACHLARGFESEGRHDQARAAWQAVVGLGTAGYLPMAHMALARLAAQEGDDARAEAELRAALATGDPEVGSRAAQDLAEYLLAGGEPGEAADVLIEALDAPGMADTARLRVLLGIAHLEMACGQFQGAVEDGADVETGALAIELLARTLPLRGRDADAETVWRYGLEHADERLSEEVRLRLGRPAVTGGGAG